MTEIINIDPKYPEKDKIERCVKYLKAGAIVAYPTDTSYGLGVDATNVSAILKLRKLKNRSLEQSISVIVSSIEMARKYAHLDESALKLIKTFMPGPLTIVVRKRSTIPDVLNKNAISFRIPANTVAISLCNALGKPITAPSANPRGLKPAYTLEKLLEYFKNKIDGIAYIGDLPYTPPSTIVDLRYETPKLIRKGPIPFKKILECLKESD